MNTEISVLILTAFSIGFLHTLMGPDHYLPFIALSRARNWSYSRTLLITVICGVGHVLSSIVIGMIGIGAGTAISRIKGFEGLRGDVAAYLLLGFGLAYMSWGIRKAIKGNIHYHSHTHTDGPPTPMTMLMKQTTAICTLKEIPLSGGCLSYLF